MNNGKANLLISLISTALALVYGIFMLLYLTDAKKCDQYLKTRDKNFREVALVITWIEVILMGLSTLGIFVALVSGNFGSSSQYLT